MKNTSSKFKEFSDSNRKRILKKPYLISGKVIIVLDQSLIKNLAINVEDTWFEQELVDNAILLKIRRSSNLGTTENNYGQL
jgi:hypothetical protein